MDINNIDDVRLYAIEQLKKLSKGEISIEQAGVSGKLCESVVSTLKVQLEYAKMLKQEPNIQFLENSTLPNGRLIEGEKEKLNLPMPKKSQMRRK